MTAFPSAPRPGRKPEDQRARLRDAAAEVFLEHGFGMTTVDMIAQQAKASKKTLYAHFTSKEELFVAAIEAICGDTLGPLVALDDPGQTPQQVLTVFGLRMLERILSPRAIAVHRLAIGEATRFPEQARLFYHSGPATLQAILTDHMRTLQAAGHLLADDPAWLASVFIQMVIGDYQRQVSMAMIPAPSPAEAQRHVQRVVALFLGMRG